MALAADMHRQVVEDRGVNYVRVAKGKFATTLKSLFGNGKGGVEERPTHTVHPGFRIVNAYWRKKKARRSATCWSKVLDSDWKEGIAISEQLVSVVVSPQILNGIARARLMDEPAGAAADVEPAVTPELHALRVVANEVFSKAFLTWSDERLKVDIKTLPVNAVDDVVRKISVYLFKYRSDREDANVRIGLLAQEIAHVLPEAVFQGTDGSLALDAQQLIAVLFKALQEVDEKVLQLDDGVAKRFADLVDALTDKSEEPPKAIAAQLRSPESRFWWIVTGVVLPMTLDAISDYVDAQVKTWHAKLPSPKAGVCLKPPKFKSCKPLCAYCSQWEAVFRKASTARDPKLNFDNGDAARFYPDPWEAAKVFCQTPIDHASKCTSAASSDATVIMNVMKWTGAFPSTVIDAAHAVTSVRNSCCHDRRAQISQKEYIDHLEKCAVLVELCGAPDVAIEIRSYKDIDEEAACQLLQNNMASLPNLLRVLNRQHEMQEQVDSLAGQLHDVDDKVGVLDERVTKLETSQRTNAPGRELFNTVPITASYFQDRAECVDIDLAFASKTRAVVNLVGLRGTGKSQLARHYAHQHASRYESLLWIDAQHDVIAQMNDAVGDPSSTKPDAAKREVKRWLCQQRVKPVLVVFDDVQQSDGAVFELLGIGSCVHYLMTSTNDEQRCDGKINVGVLSEIAASSLLHAVLKIPRPDGCSCGCTELAQQLGYLPLALVIAASYTRRQRKSFKECLDRIVLLLNQKSDRADMYGQRSMHATWKMCVDALLAEGESDAVDLLRFCSVVAPHRIPVWLLEKIAGYPALDALLRYSLVQQVGFSEGSAKFVDIHGLVQLWQQDVCRTDVTLTIVQASAAQQLLKHCRYDEDDSATWRQACEVLPHCVAVMTHGELRPDLVHLSCRVLLGYYCDHAAAKRWIAAASEYGPLRLLQAQIALNEEQYDVAEAILSANFACDEDERNRLLGHLFAARKQLSKALETRLLLAHEPRHKGSITKQARARMELANSYAATGNEPGSSLMFLAAYKLASEANQVHLAAEIALQHGTAAASIGHVNVALARFELALKHTELAFGQFHLKTAGVLEAIGGLLVRLKRPCDAAKKYRLALDIYRSSDAPPYAEAGERCRKRIRVVDAIPQDDCVAANVAAMQSRRITFEDSKISVPALQQQLQAFPGNPVLLRLIEARQQWDAALKHLAAYDWASFVSCAASAHRQAAEVCEYYEAKFAAICHAISTCARGPANADVLLLQACFIETDPVAKHRLFDQAYQLSRHPTCGIFSAVAALRLCTKLTPTLHKYEEAALATLKSVADAMQTCTDPRNKPIHLLARYHIGCHWMDRVAQCVQHPLKTAPEALTLFFGFIHGSDRSDRFVPAACYQILFCSHGLLKCTTIVRRVYLVARHLETFILPCFQDRGDVDAAHALLERENLWPILDRCPVCKESCFWPSPTCATHDFKKLQQCKCPDCQIPWPGYKMLFDLLPAELQ